MLVHFLPMEGFFCEKLLGIVVLEVEELFWDKLLKRGEFEEQPLVEQLLKNTDLVDDVLAWLLQPASFFDTFHFSSIKNQAALISRTSYGTLNCVCLAGIWKGEVRAFGLYSSFGTNTGNTVPENRLK
ncbi:unnamed protein product [Sphenostylis stenocarpa]|uniref:Uncharacterized protein n=1 Tax=Sphenostylis stenocarpa TaxID=92480 RepID=A0AA86S3H7_9FABA|nr:unnamed protein product [Sphenostylis stenocarpa]